MSAEVQRSEGDGKAAKSSGRQRGWLQWQRSDFLTAFEFSALVIMIAVVWVLLSLPVLFYYLSPFEERVDSSDDIENNIAQMHNTTLVNDEEGNTTNITVCKNVYNGGHCLEALQSYSSCDPATSEADTVHMSNMVREEGTAEEEIEDLIFSLDLYIQPSEECRGSVIPFLCLYTFGVCGANNDDYRPTAAQCMEIRDSICESEWKEASGLLALAGLPPLPDCSSLDDEGLDCEQGTIPQSKNKTECTTECHEHFYCEKNFCKPRCDRFREFSDEYVRLSDGLLITSGCVGLLCGIAVLVVFCIQYKTLMKFPTILVFYTTISHLIAEVVILISFMDRPRLFCRPGSVDLIENLKHPTDFCKLTGVVSFYIIIQGTLWWILNIIAIFWKVQFPFHSRYYDNINRTRYIHIACVVIALIFPVVAPVTLAIQGGYTLIRFPPIVCVGRDVVATFYTTVLPATLLYATGTTLVLLIVWKIRRHMVSTSHSSSGNKIQLLSSAELKLLAVFFYYLFSGALQLTTFSISTTHIDHDVNALHTYFSCQRSGEDSSCSLNLKQSRFWSLFALIVLLLFPAINLFFALKLNSAKRLFIAGGRRMTLLRRSTGISFPSSS